jgi:CBS domain-containing protein
MEVDLVVCHEHESLHDVIVKMNERNIKAIPVLDRKGRVIADLDILDLLELWLKKGNEAF